MSNELTKREWITARDAAKQLRVTERMIGHYARDGKLQTYREGRRVWYSAADVEALAGALRADLRPAQISRQDANDEIIRYVRDRKEQDRNFLEVQQQMVSGQEDVVSRLDRIEQQLQQAPRGPTWQQVIILIVALVIFVVVVLAIARFL